LIQRKKKKRYDKLHSSVKNKLDGELRALIEKTESWHLVTKMSIQDQSKEIQDDVVQQLRAWQAKKEK